MRKCPKCKYVDNPLWENSRFEFNAEYMLFNEAENDLELEEVCLALEDAPNHEPFVIEDVCYYRRGTGRIYLYRCSIGDFMVSRERKQHRRG